MSVSKMMADRLLLDSRSIVLALLNVAILRSIESLEDVREDIRRINSPHCLLADNLRAYYHLEIDPEIFQGYVELIENGQFDRAITELQDLNLRLRQKINEYWGCHLSI